KKASAGSPIGSGECGMSRRFKRNLGRKLVGNAIARQPYQNSKHQHPSSSEAPKYEPMVQAQLGRKPVGNAIGGNHIKIPSTNIQAPVKHQTSNTKILSSLVIGASLEL